ncbi:MAG: ABC transporter ATP-binding protein, partial [Phycisphaerae bacterium]
MQDDVLLEVRNLCTHFATEDGVVRAVDGVSWQVRRGETLAVVGESGCGKSVMALSIMRLIPEPPGRIVAGAIRFHDASSKRVHDLLTLRERQLQSLRGNRIAMVFQEPMSAFNPVFTIGEQVAEAVALHRRVRRKEAMDAAVKLLERVGIAAPAQRAREYPHQMSGGMLQRAMIAMAISCAPALLIADEPTTALDVTVQAQILGLLRDLQRTNAMSILFITHDLGVVAQIADRVCVMYAGRMVEEAAVGELF